MPGASLVSHATVPDLKHRTGEIASGLIVCSLPVMPRLWRQVASQLSGSGTTGNGNSKHAPRGHNVRLSTLKVSSSKKPLSSAWNNEDDGSVPDQMDYVELKDVMSTSTIITAEEGHTGNTEESVLAWA